jgi:hypothetical protein
MIVRDREVLELLREEPELLAIADAVASTQRAPRRTRGRARVLAAVTAVAAAVFALVLASPGSAEAAARFRSSRVRLRRWRAAGGAAHHLPLLDSPARRSLHGRDDSCAVDRGALVRPGAAACPSEDSAWRRTRCRRDRFRRRRGEPVRVRQDARRRGVALSGGSCERKGEGRRPGEVVWSSRVLDQGAGRWVRGVCRIRRGVRGRPRDVRSCGRSLPEGSTPQSFRVDYVGRSEPISARSRRASAKAAARSVGRCLHVHSLPRTCGWRSAFPQHGLVRASPGYVSTQSWSGSRRSSPRFPDGKGRQSLWSTAAAR